MSSRFSRMQSCSDKIFRQNASLGLCFFNFAKSIGIEVEGRALNIRTIRTMTLSVFDMNITSPNQALVPTSMSVTIPADAGLAPAILAAHL